ncbi:aldo/keto reductase [Paraburkholderia bengalensis]|uniref:Aldo/keto reductase n=1 Tax=Paraburkholderia bengalensis TaxID=2747562 RepID=A0ABU8IRQ8_9BURK
MNRRQLGTSDLMISPLGLGTWAIAGPHWTFGWGPQKDEDSIAALRQGIDGGINWIDTAPVYGLGHAEKVIGTLLSQIPGSERPLIFSKCSVLFNEKGEFSHSLSPTSIAAEVEASIKRLRVETIDLLQIHWPSFPPGGPDEGIEEAIGTMQQLKAAGKIRAIGVSNFSTEQLERAHTAGQIDSIQPPYSLLMRNAGQTVLPWAKQHSVGAITYSTLQSGLLSGRMTRERIAAMPDNDWRKTMSPEFQEPNLSRNLALVEVLRGIGARRRQSAASIAIAWVLENDAVTGAIVGARDANQAKELLPALTFRLNEEDLAEIDAALPEALGSDLAFAAAT